MKMITSLILFILLLHVIIIVQHTAYEFILLSLFVFINTEFELLLHDVVRYKC